MKTAVLFLAHFYSNSNLLKFNKLKKEITDDYDLYWVFQTDNGISSDFLIDNNIKYFHFDLEKLNELNYSPIFEYLYGSEHFIIEYFTKKHPEYNYYWIIEYDVIFNGNWRFFFSLFEDNNADFISSHIEIREDGINTDWMWWNTLSFAKDYEINKSKWVKSFNPIYRISKQALDFLDIYLKKDGNEGFYEVIMATPLYNNGFQLMDFGGTGRFVPCNFKNKIYLQGIGVNNGTMRPGPDFSVEEIKSLNLKNKLFHPLKNDFFE